MEQKKAPVIQIGNIEIRDRTEDKVLLKIKDTITFHAGDVIVLRGDNGAGKSVFLKYISDNLRDFKVSPIDSTQNSLRSFFPFPDQENLPPISLKTEPKFSLWNEDNQTLFLNTVSSFLGRENNAPKSFDISKTLSYLFENLNKKVMNTRILVLKRVLQKSTYLTKDDLDLLKTANIHQVLKLLNKVVHFETTPIKEAKHNYLKLFEKFIIDENKDKAEIRLGEFNFFFKWLSQFKQFQSFLPIKKYDRSNFHKIKNRYLSGGQSQALFIFQTMIFSELTQTTITIFDEPLNFLDVDNREYMINQLQDFIFKRANPKGVVFVVSHPTSLNQHDFAFISPMQHKDPLLEDAEKNITIDTIKNQIKLFESNPEQLKTLDAYIQKYLAIEKHEKFKKETHRKIRIFKIKKDELLEEKS